MNNGRIFGNVTRNVRQTGCWSTADCRRSCSQAKFFDRSYRYAGPSLSNGLNGLSNFVYPSRDYFRLLPTPVSQLLFTTPPSLVGRTNYSMFCFISSRHSGIFSGYTSLLFATFCSGSKRIIIDVSLFSRGRSSVEYFQVILLYSSPFYSVETNCSMFIFRDTKKHFRFGVVS